MRHVVGDLVAEHALVVVVREQHPVLVLVAVRVESEHVRLGVELELVGLLGEPLRGVAAHLDRERAAVDFLRGELRLAEDRAHRRVVLLLLRGGHEAVIRPDVEDGKPAHVVAADADEAVLVIRLHEQPMAVVRGGDGVAGGCREDVVGAAEGAVHAPPHVAERAERFAVVGRDAERQFRAGGHAVAGWCVERDRRARRLGRGLLSAERAHAARAAEDDVVDVILHVVVGAVRLVAPARGVGVEPRGAVGRREDVSVHGIAHLVGVDRQVEFDADVEVRLLQGRDVRRRDFRPVARRPAGEDEVRGVFGLGAAQDEAGVGVRGRGGVFLAVAAGDEGHARVDADGLVAAGTCGRGELEVVRPGTHLEVALAVLLLERGLVLRGARPGAGRVRPRGGVEAGVVLREPAVPDEGDVVSKNNPSREYGQYGEDDAMGHDTRLALSFQLRQ